MHAPPTPALYPNPNTGQFTLDLHSTAPESLTFSIFDLTGRQRFVATVQQGTTLLQTPAPEPGLYVWQVEQDGTVQHTGRLVVIQ